MEKHTRKSLIFLLSAMAFLLLVAGSASAQLTAIANHDHITVDFFYHGGTVSVRGISDPDTDLIITLSCDESHQSLHKKGKVAGLLWMNVGELKVENVPNVYYVHSTKKIEDILDKSEIEKYTLGYDALERHVTMNAADEGEKTKWFNEFVKYKEASNLYGTSTGKISFTEKNGSRNYYILTEWPYQVPPGHYTVTAYAVKNGKVLETATSKVFVEQVGLVKTFANMAKNNAAVYGLISILAALGAGFGVGMVFRKSGGAH